MKKLLIILLISTIATNTYAQGDRRAGNGGGEQMQRGGDRAEEMEAMIQNLSLTKEQKVKIKAIQEERKNAMKALKDDQSLSKEAKQEKMREIGKNSLTSIQLLLTEDQKQELRAAMKEKGGQGNNGGGGRGQRGGQ